MGFSSLNSIGLLKKGFCGLSILLDLAGAALGTSVGIVELLASANTIGKNMSARLALDSPPGGLLAARWAGQRRRCGQTLKARIGLPSRIDLSEVLPPVHLTDGTTAGSTALHPHDLSFPKALSPSGWTRPIPEKDKASGGKTQDDDDNGDRVFHSTTLWTIPRLPRDPGSLASSPAIGAAGH